MDVLECSKIDVDNDSNIDRSMDNRSLFIAKRFLSPTFDSAICPISSSARENIATEPTPTSSLNIFEDQNSAIENFVRYTENADLRNPTARFLTLNRGDDIQDSSISFINLIKSKYDFQKIRSDGLDLVDTHFIEWKKDYEQNSVSKIDKREISNICQQPTMDETIDDCDDCMLTQEVFGWRCDQEVVDIDVQVDNFFEDEQGMGLGGYLPTMTYNQKSPNNNLLMEIEDIENPGLGVITDDIETLEFDSDGGDNCAVSMDSKAQLNLREAFALAQKIERNSSKYNHIADDLIQEYAAASETVLES